VLAPSPNFSAGKKLAVRNTKLFVITSTIPFWVENEFFITSVKFENIT